MVNILELQPKTTLFLFTLLGIKIITFSERSLRKKKK